MNANAALNEVEQWKSIATKHMNSSTICTRRWDFVMIVAAVWLGAVVIFLAPAIAGDGPKKD